MKIISTVLLCLFILSANTVSADEQSTLTTSNKTLTFGVGIPYGMAGANVEIAPIRYFGISAGLGKSSAHDLAWSVAGRFYPVGNDNKFNPRVMILHGVVGTYSYGYYSVYSNGYFRSYSLTENIVGNAYGGGIDMKFGRNMCLDIDILHITGVSTDDNRATTVIGDNKISIGFGFRF